MSGNPLSAGLRHVLFKAFKRLSSAAGKVLLPIVQRNERLKDALNRVYKRLDSSMSAHYRDEYARLKDSGLSGEKGVNIAGYINAESGVGEAVRTNIRAIELRGIPFVLNNIYSPSRQGDRTYTDIVAENPYVFNLIHANPDNFSALLSDKGVAYLKERYNIGFWYWELSNFPEEWMYCFDYLHEVWVATDFCRDTFSKVSPVPVVKIPPSVVVEGFKEVGRGDYGVDEDEFVFFYMFDFLSHFERKNPIAIVNAFRNAFSPGDKALLLLKCANSENNTGARDRLLEAARGLNVKLIDRYMDKDEIHSLVRMCDCYVSLHRSEGFGLPMAEAMYLGKPVIATNYSGNTEFMNEQNSFPVDYTLVEIERDFGPYRKGNVWAEPDAGHAARLMRRVYDDREFARTIGDAAGRDIRKHYSDKATGERIAGRLEQVARERGLFDGGF